MDINDEIREFGEGLKSRLDPSLVDFALGYLGFSENVLGKVRISRSFLPKLTR